MLGVTAHVIPLVGMQTPAVTGVGPDELVDSWPTLLRGGWFLVGFLATVILARMFAEPALARVVRQRNRNNPTLSDAVILYARVFGVLLAILIGARVAGFDRFLGDSTLLIGAATLAVGVAAQEVIGSLVSGLALVFDPEFNVGDYIEWDDGEGTIQSIELRVTRVRARSGELVTIPNTILTSQSITRPFGQGEHCVVENVRIAPDDVDEAVHHLEAAIQVLDTGLANPSPNVYIDEFGEDEVVLRVHYWIDDPDRQDVMDIRTSYARDVLDRLEHADIDVSPPPKRDLQGRIEVDDTK